MASWLADRVAPGKVVALDKSTVFLDQIGRPNLDVMQSDVTIKEFPAGSFDLIHARLLLMHLPEREEVLTRLVSWLAPGGWIILSDGIDPITATSSNLLYRALMAGVQRAMYRAMGTDTTWARNYPTLLSARRLTNIDVEVNLPHLQGGSPLANFLRTSITPMREQIIADRFLDGKQFDTAIGFFSDPEFHGLAPGLITAWGQRQ